jgi:DNA-nicking Smr family endonuclease
MPDARDDKRAWGKRRTNGDCYMAKLKLDLHDIYNKGRQIDAELNRIVQEAVDKKIELVEIIPGKGSGQLKKKVLRFLEQKHIKTLYHRIEKDDKNFGRIFVHFRF